MKLPVFVMMLLMVGVVLFLFAMMAQEAETTYNIDINTSEWEGQYDFATSINSTVAPIKTSIDTIQNEEKGWLNKVGAGFTGIVAAVTFLPALVGNIALMGGQLITGLGKSFGLPSYIVLVFILGLVIWGIFKLLEFYNRWQI